MMYSVGAIALSFLYVFLCTVLYCTVLYCTLISIALPPIRVDTNYMGRYLIVPTSVL